MFTGYFKADQGCCLHRSTIIVLIDIYNFEEFEMSASKMEHQKHAEEITRTRIHPQVNTG